ncbi:MAG: hypothetical protein ACMUJM_18540 [bacterium]
MNERTAKRRKILKCENVHSIYLTGKSDLSKSLDSPIDHTLFFHRAIGNKGIQRLVESDHIQAKLRVNQSNDKYEQEADRITEQVMNMPEPRIHRQSEKEEEEEYIQTGVTIHEPMIYRKEEEQKLPTPEELLEAWLNKWKKWKQFKARKEARGEDWKLDCGVAARQVLLSLGGKRHKTVFKPKWHPTFCKPKEGKEALSRGNSGIHDKIESDVCYMHSGKGRNVSVDTFTLKPGMLLYTAEQARPFSEEEIEERTQKTKPSKKQKMKKWLESIWRWDSRHMVMYFGEDKILDTVSLTKPSPRPFKPFYVASQSDCFVVLRIYDPFIHLRGSKQ